MKIRESMLFVRIGMKTKEHSGLIPHRIFSHESESDAYISQHKSSKTASPEFVKFDVVTEETEEGVCLWLFDPTGDKTLDEYCILSRGLYAGLKSGLAPTPESERN